MQAGHAFREDTEPFHGGGGHPLAATERAGHNLDAAVGKFCGSGAVQGVGKQARKPVCHLNGVGVVCEGITGQVVGFGEDTTKRCLVGAQWGLFS